MTIAEMLMLFTQRYDNSSNTNTGLTNNEKYVFINSAIDKFISNKFTGNNTLKQSFEQSPKRFEDLRTITKRSNVFSPPFGNVVEIPNSITITVPTDYRFLLSLHVEIINPRLSNNPYWTEGERIPNATVGKWVYGGHNKPQFSTPKIVMRDFDKFTILYENGATIQRALISYIRNPVQVGFEVDCDLPDHTHREIVELAVNLALEADESPKYQSSSKIITELE